MKGSDAPSLKQARAGRFMTSRQRVLDSLDHREPDRVPLDLGGINNTSLHLRIEEALKKHLGLEGEESEIRAINQQVVIPDERILRYFGVDTRSLYIDEAVPWREAGGGTWVDQWGLGYRLNPDGHYYNFHTHPLAEAVTVEEIDTYRFPDPFSEKRVSGLRERAESLGDEYCLILEGLREPVFGLCAWLRESTRFYMDLAADPVIASRLLDRMLDFQLELTGFLLERLHGCVDVVKVGDDLGMQSGLLISPGMYQQYIKPRQAVLYRHIKETGKCRLLLHSCGSIREIIPDLIEIGVDAINPVQTTAAGMEPSSLKREFGKEITFWGGGIDTQHVLPYGTPEQVRSEVERNMEIFKPGGGFVFAQIHNIMPEVPLENVLAMFEAYRKSAPYSGDADNPYGRL